MDIDTLVLTCLICGFQHNLWSIITSKTLSSSTFSIMMIFTSYSFLFISKYHELSFIQIQRQLINIKPSF